jgi:hypothetical protein
MENYQVNFKRRDTLWDSSEKDIGVAYAFFDSDASIGDIGDLALQEAERPERTTKISDLEIALVDLKEFRARDNPEVYSFIQKYSVSPIGLEGKPKSLKNLKYALQVAVPGTTNEQMGDYLGNVMNDVYSMGNPDKPTYMSIVYRNPEDGCLDFKQD